MRARTRATAGGLRWHCALRAELYARRRCVDAIARRKRGAHLSVGHARAVEKSLELHSFTGLCRLGRVVPQSGPRAQEWPAQPSPKPLPQPLPPGGWSRLPLASVAERPVHPLELSSPAGGASSVGELPLEGGASDSSAQLAREPERADLPRRSPTRRSGRATLGGCSASWPEGGSSSGLGWAAHPGSLSAR